MIFSKFHCPLDYARIPKNIQWGKHQQQPVQQGGGGGEGVSPLNDCKVALNELTVLTLPPFWSPLGGLSPQS